VSEEERGLESWLIRWRDAMQHMRERIGAFIAAVGMTTGK
jgi:hypothetical protein